MDEDGTDKQAYLEQRYDELTRQAESWRTLFSSTLGLLLFSSPSSIMAFVNRWMTHDIFNHALSEAPKETESFEKLLRRLVTDNTDIQIELRRARSATTGRETMDAGIAFLHSDDNNISAFACSKLALMQSLESENRAMPGSDNNTLLPTLLSTIMTCLVASANAGSVDGMFLHAKPNLAGDGVLFKCFPLSALVGTHRDNSAFLIAIGVYLVSQYEEIGEQESMNAQPTNRGSTHAGDQEKRMQLHYASLREACSALLSTYSDMLVWADEQRHDVAELLDEVGDECPDEYIVHSGKTIRWMAARLGRRDTVCPSNMAGVLRALWRKKSTHLLQTLVECLDSERLQCFCDYLKNYSASRDLQ